MAVMGDFLAKGYFDDSQTSGKVWVVGGYMGSALQWEHFEEHWPIALAKHDVPYFHKREMANPKGVYAKWHPPQEHREELASFFADLASVISESYLNGFCCAVRMQDLERFNTEKGLKLQAYSLAAYGCMVLIGRNYLGKPAEMIFDHVEKVQSKLAQAQEYADTDRLYGAGGEHAPPDGVFGKLVTTGLPKDITSREIPALQAADFWVWEYRKSHLKLDDWWSLSDRPQEWGDEQWEHMDKWMTENHGGWDIATRKSLQALLTQQNFECMIWGYQELIDAHNSRGGVWSSVQKGE